MSALSELPDVPTTSEHSLHGNISSDGSACVSFPYTDLHNHAPSNYQYHPHCPPLPHFDTLTQADFWALRDQAASTSARDNTRRADPSLTAFIRYQPPGAAPDFPPDMTASDVQRVEDVWRRVGDLEDRLSARWLSDRPQALNLLVTDQNGSILPTPSNNRIMRILDEIASECGMPISDAGSAAVGRSDYDHVRLQSSGRPKRSTDTGGESMSLTRMTKPSG